MYPAAASSTASVPNRVWSNQIHVVIATQFLVKSSCSHVDRGSVNGLQSVLAHATNGQEMHIPCMPINWTDGRSFKQIFASPVPSQFEAGIFLLLQPFKFVHFLMQPSASPVNAAVRRGREARELKVLLRHEANSCLEGKRRAFWQTPCLTSLFLYDL